MPAISDNKKRKCSLQQPQFANYKSMFATVIVFIAFLVNLTTTALLDKCKELSSIKPTEFNIKSIFQLYKDSPVKVDGGFTASVIGLIPYGAVERTSVIKKIPIQLATDVAFLTQFMPKPGILEDKFVDCLVDGSEVYVLKTCYHRSELCTEVNEELLQQTQNKRQFEKPKLRLKDGLLFGEIGKLNKFIETQPEEFKGDDYTMRLLSLDDGHLLSVLTIPFDKIAIREVKVSQIFSKTAHAPAFRGCFKVGKTIHFISDKYPFYAATNDFMTRFRQDQQALRAHFYYELSQAIAEFEQTGYVHNDVKPSSFVVDTEGTPRLVNFVDSKKRGGKDVNPRNRMFASPLRVIEKVADNFNDVYSLCASIVAFESSLGEFVFNYDMTTGTLVDDSNYPKMPSSAERHFENVIRTTMEQKWGAYDSAEVNYSAMNLTTLIMRVMVQLDRHLSPRKFMNEMQRIWLSYDHLQMI